jgi:hypothetical protein
VFHAKNNFAILTTAGMGGYGLFIMKLLLRVALWKYLAPLQRLISWVRRRSRSVIAEKRMVDTATSKDDHELR